MSKFNDFIIEDLKNQDDMLNLLEVAMFITETPYIVEGEKTKNIIKMIKDMIPRLGLSVKPGRGLIHMLLKASDNIRLLLYHSFMAYYNNDKFHKEKMKDILKNVKKEDFMEFILKLDMVTLHAISGPIHAISAITGWKINVLDKRQEEIKSKIKKAINSLETLAISVGADIKNKISKYIDALKNLFNSDTYGATI